MNLSLELNLICEFYSNIASQSFTRGAALTLRPVSQPPKCFGITVTGLTHQKRSRGLQRRRTVSTATFHVLLRFTTISRKPTASQTEKKIMGPTCCYRAFPLSSGEICQILCLMKDLEFNRLVSEKNMSDCVTWPRCKGGF